MQDFYYNVARYIAIRYINTMIDISKPIFYILIALAGQPLHGYAIMKQIEDQSAGSVTLGPGTLYGALKRLLEEELIEEVQGTTERGKRHYQLTEKGRKQLTLETQRLEAMVRLSRKQFMAASI